MSEAKSQLAQWISGRLDIDLDDAIEGADAIEALILEEAKRIATEVFASKTRRHWHGLVSCTIDHDGEPPAGGQRRDLEALGYERHVYDHTNMGQHIAERCCEPQPSAEAEGAAKIKFKLNEYTVPIWETAVRAKAETEGAKAGPARCLAGHLHPNRHLGEDCPRCKAEMEAMQNSVVRPQPPTPPSGVPRCLTASGFNGQCELHRGHGQDHQFDGIAGGFVPLGELVGVSRETEATVQNRELLEARRAYAWLKTEFDRVMTERDAALNATAPASSQEEALRSLCAAVYQIVGVLSFENGGPTGRCVPVLDALSAAARGLPIVGTEELLPFNPLPLATAPAEELCSDPHGRWCSKCGINFRPAAPAEGGKDKERIDWLELTGAELGFNAETRMFEVDNSGGRLAHCKSTIRAAIDAARGAEGKS